MKNLLVRTSLLLAVLGSLFPALAESPLPVEIDWAEELGRYDMLWDRMPTRWDEGPFLGNGEQGTLVYAMNKKTIRWDVGCSAAHDHRPVEKD
ncbi:MAG: hypothetical protein ACQKBU_03125, partial [Verrucomicrobiales bacterium]